MESKNKVRPAAPMTAEEVKNIKAQEAETVRNDTASITSDQQIETEVIDGLIYPKGCISIGVKAESTPL